MKDGICAKCEAKEVHVVSQTGVEIAINVGREMAYLNYYVCTNCGYTELFVRDSEMLQQIAWKYRRIRRD
jgi:predicted nucleic-acid-binding Zn-ribbon protein